MSSTPAHPKLRRKWFPLETTLQMCKLSSLHTACVFLQPLKIRLIGLLHCYFQGVDLTPKKGVKKKGTKRLHFWSKIHSGIAYSI